MKKSLIFLSLAAASVLVGCQSAEPDAQDIRMENYTQAFVSQFGFIDPNHDWGFGRNDYYNRAPAVMSRNTNFTDPNNNEWKNPPGIKQWELDAVIEYLRDRQHRVGVEDITVTAPYFVTNVGSSRVHGLKLDGNTTDNSLNASMDQLKIAYAPGYDITATTDAGHWGHVNNFNGGDNPNKGGNMVVVEGSTLKFCCRTSTSDEVNFDYMIIPGGNVDYRLAQYYYVCFDFKALSKAQTIMSVVYLDNSNTEQTTDISVNGYYENGNGITKAMILSSFKDKRGMTLAESSIKSFTFKDYDGKSQTILPDGSYDDWIIRIVGGAIKTSSDEIPIYPHDDPNACRIFVEDLAVSANNNFSSSDSDWDFNDLVFDAKFIKIDGKDYLDIVIRAVGGTLPIYLRDNSGRLIEYNGKTEVHDMFGEDSYEMINTGQGPSCSPISFKIPLGADGYDINVGEYGQISVAVEYNGELVSLDNDKGNTTAPCKLCVPSYLANPLERVCIQDVYSFFPDYVADRNVHFWEHAIDPNKHN